MKKIFEIAQSEFKVRPTELVDLFKKIGVYPKNHMAEVSDEEIIRLQNFLAKERDALEKKVKKEAEEAAYETLPFDKKCERLILDLAKEFPELVIENSSEEKKAELSTALLKKLRKIVKIHPKRFENYKSK